MNYELSLNSILLAVFAICSATLGILLQRKTERIKIIENQLSQKKYDAYADLVAIFYDLIKDTKGNTKKNENDLATRIIDAKKNLFFYGSDEVFKKFSAWLVYSNKSQGDIRHIHYFLEMMILIRKDMGNKRTKLIEKDILISLTQSEEEYKKIIELTKIDKSPGT